MLKSYQVTVSPGKSPEPTGQSEPCSAPPGSLKPSPLPKSKTVHGASVPPLTTVMSQSSLYPAA